MIAYMTRVRMHLAASLAHDVPFERAWTDALRACPKAPGWDESDLHTAKAAFREAYVGGSGTGVVGILADRSTGLSVDEPTPAPYEAPTHDHRCGSGALGPARKCPLPVAPPRWVRKVSKPKRFGPVRMFVREERPSYLCVAHQEQIKTAMANADYRSRQEIEFDLDPIAA